jgi:hypothetical protein
MARAPMFKASEKRRIVLSVLRGEASLAEAARLQPLLGDLDREVARSVPAGRRGGVGGRRVARSVGA